MPTADLPDFDEMINIARQIREKMLIRDHLDAVIKARESEIYKITSTDSRYFSNNKPPSATYIKSAYEFTGLDGELIELREKLSEAIADIEMLRITFDIMKMMVDVYRTESANKRIATL